MRMFKPRTALLSLNYSFPEISSSDRHTTLLQLFSTAITLTAMVYMYITSKQFILNRPVHSGLRISANMANIYFSPMRKSLAYYEFVHQPDAM